MTDNRVEQGYYQQSNNPNNQQYSQQPQQVNQNYQQTQPNFYPQSQQPYNQGYQPHHDPYNQQVGVNQPGTQVGYYNPNVNPLQQPYNAGIPGSVNPVQNSKEQYKGFFNVLLLVITLVSLRFGYDLILLIVVIVTIPVFIYIFILFLVLVVNALVVIFARKMMKGFQNNDAKPIREGKPFMIGLFVLRLIFAVLTLLLGLYFVGFSNWILFVALTIAPEILLVYIIAKCDQVALLLERIPSLYAGPQV